MATFLSGIRSLALLLARLCLGGILILHGTSRWVMDGPNAGIQGTINYLTQFGVPYVEIVAWSLVSIEVVGGIMLVAGVFTPVVAALIIAEQAFLIAYTTWYRNVNLLNADLSYNGGWEYNAALIALALIFLTFGAGKIAVDALFGRKKSTQSEDEFASGTNSFSASDTRVSAGV